MEWKIIAENYLAALVAFLIYFIGMLLQHLVFTKAGDIHKGWLILHCLILFAFFLGATFRISVKLEEAEKQKAQLHTMSKAIEQLKKKAADIEYPPEPNSIETIAKELGLSPQDVLARLEKGTKLDQGLKAYFEHQYDQANRLFLENATANETEAAQSYFYLGNTFCLKAEYQKATEAFKRSTDLQPKYPPAWYNWGNALAHLDRHEEAIKKYEQAIKYQPDAADAWNNWGAALAGQGRHKEAIEKYEQAIKYQPDLAPAWYNWGAVLAGQGRHKEAIEKYEQAIKHQPDHAGAWNNWGNALAHLDRHEEAIKKYEQAIKYQPDLAPTWYNWGLALARLDRQEEAIEKFREAIKYQPDHASAWYNWGVALDVLDRQEEAKEKYKQAEQIRSKTNSSSPNFPTKQWTNPVNHPPHPREIP